MAIEQLGKVSADESLRYHLMDLEKAERDRISEANYVIKQAKLEGKLEGKLEDAAKMLEEKIPVPVIIKITGLTQEQLNKLN